MREAPSFIRLRRTPARRLTALAFPALLVALLLAGIGPALASLGEAAPVVPVWELDPSTYGAQNPDISYNLGLDRYLVVWQRWIPLPSPNPVQYQVDIMGRILQRDSLTNTLVPDDVLGDVFEIAASVVVATWADFELRDGLLEYLRSYRPSVASTDSDHWVVAYLEDRSSLDGTCVVWASKVQLTPARDDIVFPLPRLEVDVVDHPEPLSKELVTRVDIGAAPASARYLVVWDAETRWIPLTQTREAEVCGRLVTEGLENDGDRFVLHDASFWGRNPTVNQRGSMFLVAWEMMNGAGVYARAVDPISGLDPLALTLPLRNDADGRKNHTPDVAADDGSADLVHFLVVWNHQATYGFDDTDIWGSFVTHDASQPPPLPTDTFVPAQDVERSGLYEKTPSVAYTGLTDTFMLSWAAIDPGSGKSYVRAGRFVRQLDPFRRGIKGPFEQVSVDPDPNIDEQHPAVSTFFDHGGVAVVWDRQTWLAPTPPAPEPELWARIWYPGDGNVGLYDPAVGTFYLRDTNDSGGADHTFDFGPAALVWVPVVGDWDGSGTETIGLLRRDEGKFYLRNTNDAGPADVVVRFGPQPNKTWIPIAGDWDGDVTVTIGFYDQVNGVFYLRNKHEPGEADITFSFGPSGSNWLPIVGDWDGLLDGNTADTVGLYDPFGGVFYLRNSNDAGPANTVFRFGPELSPTPWLPIAGDWDGGVPRDTVGLYDPTTGTFFLRNANTAGIADVTFGFGPASSKWSPIAGDWNGDMRTTVGLYDPNTGRFYLRNANSPGVANLTFVFGGSPKSALPVAADWNRDGMESIGLYRQDIAKFYVSYFNRAGLPDLLFSYGPTARNWLPIAGDWNGDGTGTIGLYDPDTGRFYLRNSNTGGPAEVPGPGGFRYGPALSTWLPIVGDWDGDGDDTVGLYNQSTGTFYLRNSNDAGPADITFRYGSAPSTSLPLADDWDHDGTDTIGLYDPATGQLYLRYSNDAGIADLVFNFGPAPSTWLPFTGDWDGL